MESTQASPVAVIVNRTHRSADGVLAEFANQLREQGWRVRGVVQDNVVSDNNCGRQMVLIDVSDGSRFPISQNLGTGSASCCVDPGGVVAASVALRRGLTDGADLVIANRFGELEAGGGGFAAEMLALMAEGIPLLTVVNERYLEDWRRFTGNTAQELEPQRQSLDAWFAKLVQQRKPVQ